MAIDIADLTLAEVVRHLIAGDALQVSGGVEFSLPLPDSRTVLAFYNQNRQAYWNPDKDTNILDREIDRLLDSPTNGRRKPADSAAVYFPQTLVVGRCHRPSGSWASSSLR